MKKVLLFAIIMLLAFNISAYNFGKNKIQADGIAWSVLETMHFDIYYQKGEDDFGRAAALMAEEAYYHIRNDMSNPIRHRIPIIFYKSRQDFETTNVIYPLLSEGVGGFTESAKNRIAVPFSGSYKALEEVLIHELTHAYINDLNRNRNKFMKLTGLPFWFQEGFPEFESVHGEDVYNNMFIIDLLVNDGIPYLDEIGGFFSYRLGESFLTYIEAEYGRDQVINLFYALRYNSTSDLAFKKVFDLEFKEIQKRWKNYLRREYFVHYDSYNIPYEVFEQKTDHEKDGSYMNYAPRFSPDGKNYVYYSNRNIRNEIWLGQTLDLKKNERIVKGESTGKFEEFHFQKNNLSWFQDSERFAFVAKTSNGDKIYGINYLDGSIVNTISLPEFQSIYEIDISHDNNKIVFCGQKNEQTDIFIYDLQTKEVTQITNDHYYDRQPTWSADDSKIAFASERSFIEGKKHVFDNLSSDIYYYEISENSFYQVTDDPFDNYSPFWSSADEILFISEGEITTNFQVINLENGKSAAVTNVLGGVFTGDLNADDSELIFSCYYDGGWDIYQKSNPLDSLNFIDYQMPSKVELTDDLFEISNIEEYKYFGKIDRKFMKEIPEYPSRITKLDISDFAKIDSTRKEHNQKIDEKPTEINEPEIIDYKTKFTLDYMWGGMAYSPSIGTYAQVEFGLSDLMGNHSLGFNLGVTGALETSDIVVNYLYLAKRIDYGIGSFFLNDELIYWSNYNNQDNYFRERINEFGIYTILRYPFNKFWRLDWENVLYTTRVKRDWWDGDDWIEEYLNPGFAEYYDLDVTDVENVYSPQFTLVHDNTIYGSVGPIAGWRAALLANRNFSNKDNFSVLFGDIRSYNFFAKRYSIALRATGGAIMGDTNQRFEMEYFNGVRGFKYDGDEDLLGKRKFLTSFELRYPFIDNLKMSFPLPLVFYQVRGSAFMDLGAIWTEDDDLKLYHNNKLHDMMMGIGFGPRLNMGYFILKFDVAWQTDLESFSKPSYYFTLTPDF
jgi:Tol biopolymer transport system component